MTLAGASIARYAAAPACPRSAAAMTEVPSNVVPLRATPLAPLRYVGADRDPDIDVTINVWFSRELTDEELDFLRDVLGRTAPLMEAAQAR